MFLLTIMMSGLAFSHAKITATVPADGDFVAAPKKLVLTFDSPVQLTGVDLRTVDGETLYTPAFTSDPATVFDIDVPGALSPGEYYVVWKSIAADSHFSTGEFFFTVVVD